MRRRLRLGSSGPKVFRADGSEPSIGDILTSLLGGSPVWSPLAIPGGTGLLSNVFFIDQGATVAGTGSITAPFQSFTQAMAGVPVILSTATFWVTPYDYSAEPPIHLQLKYYAFLGIGGGANGFAPGGPPYVITPDIICDDADNNGCGLFFYGCSTDVTAARSLIECDLTSIIVRAGSPGALVSTTRVYARGDGRQVISATADFVEARGMRVGAMTINTGIVQSSNFIDCTIGGNQTTSNQTYADCPFTSTVTITATNLTWDADSKHAAARSNSLLFVSGNIIDTSITNVFYGDAHNGNVVLGPGITAIDNFVEYQNLTVPAGSQLQLRATGILRVKGVLDISLADSGAITGRANVTIGPFLGTSGQGGNAVGAVGGAAGAFQNVGNPVMLSGSIAGTAGATATVNAGTTAVVPPAMAFAVGSNSGASGAGGKGGGGGGKAGGATGAPPTLTNPQQYPNWERIVTAGGDGIINTSLGGGQSGRGGSSGGGDTVNLAGGGGGGGAGPHFGPYVYANYIRTSATMPISVIASWGCKGGNGGNSAGGDSGGGGGGAGGGGGFAGVLYDYRLNAAPPAGIVDARGGNAGNGGNGTGAGEGGTGGTGGTGGQVVVVNRLTGVLSRVLGVVGTAGAGPAGTAGGAGGLGGACATTIP